MTSLTDLNASNLGNLLSNAVDSGGIVVKAKTDIGPELKVYDSDDPSGESTSSFLVPEIGLTVYNRNGRVLATYGGQPKINILKAGVYYGLLGTGLFIIFKGIKGIILK